MSERYPHLNRAPISEALLDIRVELPPGVDIALMRGFHDAVAGEFPDVRPILQVHAGFSLRDQSAEVSKGETGAVCWNEDHSRAVQGRLDGFTVNHVKLYENWGKLREQAHRYWQVYVDRVAPAAVTRCALRYINRFEIDGPSTAESLLRTRPLVSSGLPSEPLDYFMRVLLPFAEDRRAVITQVMEQPDAESGRRALILDIDAYRTLRLPPDSEDLWKELDALHDIKNECFFESLQETTWRSYQ